MSGILRHFEVDCGIECLEQASELDEDEQERSYRDPSAGNHNSIHCRLLVELANYRQEPIFIHMKSQQPGVKYHRTQQ